jgi:FtsZ-binding cell division protein ZapB
LQAKRKAFEKLEKLNQAKEQIEAIQREIDEMKEQENSSLWQESPPPKFWTKQKSPERKFFRGKRNLTVRGF